jgi:hypothetical protein
VKIDLDKAERLIRSIRTKESELAQLYEEWESLVPVSNGNGAYKPPARKPDPNSATSKIFKAISGSADEFTSASFPRIANEKKAKAILEKMVYQKKIRRIRTGVYGRVQEELAGVA